MTRSTELPAKCIACSQPFSAEDELLDIPAPRIALRGEKSGMLGAYPHPKHPEEEREIVHLQCAGAFHDPESNPHRYDEVSQQVREDLEPEIREEMSAELNEKLRRVVDAMALKQSLPNICRNCWADNEPLMCIFCKRTDCVWEKHLREGVLFWCQLCNKSWNQDEEELGT